MKKVVSKGYTITVNSWENDGDNYQNHSNTVNTLEEVKQLSKVLPDLFLSLNRNGLVGNANDESDFDAEEVIKYMKRHPNLIPKGYDEMDAVNNLHEYYMGTPSEHFLYRVFNSMSVVYSPEDIYLEEIELTNIK